VLKIDDSGFISYPRITCGTTTVIGSVNNVDVLKVDVTVNITWWQWIIIIALFGWIWY